MAKYTKKYTKEQIQEAVSKSVNYSDVFRNLGITINGGSYNWIKKTIKGYEISTEHFHTSNTALHLAAHRKTKEDLIESYSKNDISGANRIRASKLRRYLIFNKIKEECKTCGLSEWIGTKMRLDIDHINGNPLDNKLENLQFLCPNCHRCKTITYSDKENMDRYLKDNPTSKKVKLQLSKEANKCVCCDKIISENATKCMSCAKTGLFKIVWPEDTELSRLLWEKPCSTLAKELGVSDKAIEKRCIKRNIAKPPLGYWRKKECGLL